MYLKWGENMLKSHQIALSLVAALAESVGAEIGCYFLNLLGYLGWGVTIKKAKWLTCGKFREGMCQVPHSSSFWAGTSALWCCFPLCHSYLSGSISYQKLCGFILYFVFKYKWSWILVIVLWAGLLTAAEFNIEIGNTQLADVIHSITDIYSMPYYNTKAEV